MANAEEGVKGRFWEGRFKSQALLDEKALLAETPEASDFTSIQERIGEIPEDGGIEQVLVSEADSEFVILDEDGLQEESKVRSLPRAESMPFDATSKTRWAIPFAFDDYLELVDWTRRAVHPDKRGRIPAHYPKLLDRLGIDGDRFVSHADRLLKNFGSAVGAPETLVSLCAQCC